jgi:hypothetical protein
MRATSAQSSLWLPDSLPHAPLLAGDAIPLPAMMAASAGGINILRGPISARRKLVTCKWRQMGSLRTVFAEGRPRRVAGVQTDALLLANPDIGR